MPLEVDWRELNSSGDFGVANKPIESSISLSGTGESDQKCTERQLAVLAVACSKAEVTFADKRTLIERGRLGRPRSPWLPCVVLFGADVVSLLPRLRS